MKEDKDVVFESKLIPVLRQGVEVVKMILFMKIKEFITETQPSWAREYQLKIVGAVLNEIFGIVHPEERFQEFAHHNSEKISSLIRSLPATYPELLIPLTDALRTSVLCDYQEGADTSAILSQAESQGLLLKERDLPMPHRFIELVRRLGSSFGLVVPPAMTEAVEDATNEGE